MDIRIVDRHSCNLEINKIIEQVVDLRVEITFDRNITAEIAHKKIKKKRFVPTKLMEKPKHHHVDLNVSKANPNVSSGDYHNHKNG